MQVIHTKNAPKALGPYSQAIVAGAMLFCSGQIGINPETGELVNSSIEAETEQVMANIENILHEARFGRMHVVKSTIYTTDLAYFDTINEIYGKNFIYDKPARSCVQVAALPKGARVEIEVIAYK